MRTPVEKWKKMLAVHKKRCQAIMGISKSIRYAGVINEYGRTLTGVFDPSTKLLLNQMDVKNEFFVVSTVMSQRKGSAAKIGKLEHVLLVHKKVFVLLIHRDPVTYYVSINRNARNIDDIISKIKKTVARPA